MTPSFKVLRAYIAAACLLATVAAPVTARAAAAKPGADGRPRHGHPARGHRDVRPANRALVAPDAATTAGSVAHGGMVVGIDAESGALGMPDPGEMRRLAGLAGLSLNHSGEGLVQQRLPDGSTMIDLQGRFREYYVVHLDGGGHLLRQCLDDPAAIRRALVQPPSPPLEER